MPRKRAKPKPFPTRPLLKAALVLVACAGSLALVIVLGGLAQDDLANHPRYAVPFAGVQCDAPPGRTREAFLSEVRYLSGVPESVSAISPRLGETLATAFAKHPWVAEVLGVEVSPAREVRINLRFREPVLVVRVAGEPSERLVDAKGTLLPPTPRPEGVAVLAGTHPPPTVAAGKVWDNATVRRAAQLVAEFRGIAIEKSPECWRITQAGGRVLQVSH